LTNFPNGKQTQESLEIGFPESEFRETNMAYFSVSFLFIIDDLFFHFFTQWLLICLVRCMHKFFDLHLRFFYVKKHVEKFCMFNFFFIMFWCFRFDPYFYDFWFFSLIFLCSIHVFFCFCLLSRSLS
jgi:hypothetical protein